MLDIKLVPKLLPDRSKIQFEVGYEIDVFTWDELEVQELDDLYHTVRNDFREAVMTHQEFKEKVAKMVINVTWTGGVVLLVWIALMAALIAADQLWRLFHA